jgi:hypothetical protein
MQFKAKEKIISATVELNYEEMVMLRALLQRARNEVVAKFRPTVISFGPYLHMNVLEPTDYGQDVTRTNDDFLLNLHNQLKQATQGKL